MAKRTLLDLTQSILSAIDGDEVNSVSDTIESMQIANLVRECFFAMVDELDLPAHQSLVALESLADTSRPTHMRIPENCSKILWIEYDRRIDPSAARSYGNVRYREPKDFIDIVARRPNTDLLHYQLVQYSADIPMTISTNSGPNYWTTFDDEYIIFDSFNQSVDSTLQASKTICQGTVRPDLVIADDTIPDLPDNLFSYLYAKVEARAFANYKQQPNPKSEQEERRARVRIQRNNHRAGRKLHEGPDFGWK